MHWDTLTKILGHSKPPDYRKQTPREKPVLGLFVAIIHEILEADRKAPPKQRRTESIAVPDLVALSQTFWNRQP